MTDKNWKNQKQGISNLVAVLILIAIAVVGGGIVFTSFYGQMQRMTKHASLRTKSLDLVSTDTSNLASATVKNNGTVALENVEIKVMLGEGENVVLRIGRLAPGEFGSDHAQGSLIFISGKSYPVLITAEGSDGSTVFSKAMSVRVD